MKVVQTKTVAILLIALAASQPKAWGQSGSWADNCATSFSNVDGENKIINITSAGELALLASAVNKGTSYAGYTINLTTDINLSAHYWVPIGTATHPFNGTFVGGSHTVSGLNISDGSLDNAGLFGYASGATVSNLTVSAGSIAADEKVGVLAGSLISSTISDCSVSATSISGTQNVSALVGYRDKVTATSCSVTATAVSLANSSDNSTTLSGCQNKPCDVTLSGRTLYKDGKWNTICLPFDYDPAYGVLAGDGVEVYELTNAAIAVTRLNLFFGDNVAGNGVMHAGKPYIIKWTSGSGEHLTNPAFQGVVPRVTAPVDYDNEAAGDARVRFRGTFSSQALPAADQSILFMGGNNTLYYPKSGTGTTLGACRAYFKIGNDGAGVRQLDSFDFTFGEENVTGIIEMSDVRCEMSEGWYTLDGRKLGKQPTQKGIYIINGKKRVIK